MLYHLAALSLMSVMSVHFEICVSATLLLFEKFDVTEFFLLYIFLNVLCSVDGSLSSFYVNLICMHVCK